MDGVQICDLTSPPGNSDASSRLRTITLESIKGWLLTAEAYIYQVNKESHCSENEWREGKWVRSLEARRYISLDRLRIVGSSGCGAEENGGTFSILWSVVGHTFCSNGRYHAGWLTYAITKPVLCFLPGVDKRNFFHFFTHVKLLFTLGFSPMLLFCLKCIFFCPLYHQISLD